MADRSNAVLNPMGEAVLSLVLQVPGSREEAIEHPTQRVRILARQAARNASLMAGSLSLPPGVLGWLTVLPELLAVWRLQAQMVSDIAAAYGKHTSLGREQMLYCLFKHVSAQLFRDVAVQVGERMLMRQTSAKVLQALVQKLAPQISQSILRRGATRLLPLLGAIGVGAYAYFDTMQVAQTAVELFEREIVTPSEI